jgi:predicted transposase/invertase (TIGR01784 family)
MLMTEFNIDVARDVWQEEAHEEGREQGRAEGEMAKAFSVAKKMLEMDMSIDEISDVTGLTHEEILKLQANG